MTHNKLIATVVAALIFGIALALAGCDADRPAPPASGPVIAPPPADEEMCRERFRPNLCPEV